MIAGRLGVDHVNPKSINGSLDKLRTLGLVIWVERGKYIIEYGEVVALLIASRTDIGALQSRLPDTPADEISRKD